MWSSQSLSIVLIILIYCPDAFGAGTNYVEPASCGLIQFFETNTMLCQQCGPDQIISNTSLSCVCRPGFRQNSSSFDLQRCEMCPSADKQVISIYSTCIDCPVESPAARDGRCDCPVGFISVDTETTGEILSRRRCVQCTRGFVPNERKTACVPCSAPNLSFEVQASCIDIWSRECNPPSGVPAPSFCLRIDETFRQEAQTQTSIAIGSTNNRITSAYYNDFYRLAISRTLCTRTGRSSSCSLVSNLCTLRGSSGDLDRAERLCNPNTQANMIITDAETETKLPPVNFITDRSREFYAAGNIYSYLDLRAAVFNINGSFEGWRNASDGFLQLCLSKQRFPDAWLGFGVNYKVNCKISARDFWRSFETKYYQLYIVFPERDEAFNNQRTILKKFSVPVKMISPFGQEAKNFLARFFMVDKDSLRRFEGSRDGPIDVIRYASKVTLLIRVNGTDAILPSQLRITYSDVFLSNQNTMLDIEFAVNYEGSGATFDDIVRMLLISLIAAGIYVGIKLYGWFQRRGGDCDQGACILPSIMLMIAGCGNILALVALAISIWYLIAYKFQNFAVFMLPSKDDGERGFILVAVIACACKLIHCLQIIIQQSTVDVFFLDWEQPKLSQIVSLSSGGGPGSASGTATPVARGSVVSRQPKPINEAKPPVREHLHPVSVWRTLFVGNEWNELQVCRRTNPVIQIVVVMVLIEFVGLGNLATGDPYTETNLSPQYYRSEIRRVLRFGITSSMYILFAVAQWLFFLFIYERWVEDSARNFVDLCALSNISVFILAEQRHGYYIHGRLLHGHADTSQKELADFLKSEAKDESPQGGLFGTAQRTFEIMVPLRIRTTIDAYLLQIRQASGSKQRSVRNAPGHSSTDYSSLAAAQEALKFFISNEVEKNGSNNGTVMRLKKSFLENIFDIECMRNPEGMIFYEDDGRSFENVLLLGHEMTLVLFELLLFSIIDMFACDATIAGLATYVVGKLLITIRANYGEKNVALKTGVDERFLI